MAGSLPRPGIDPAAVCECLRYQPAVALVLRITLQDIVLDDTWVPAGKIPSLSTLSALRDPALYPDPERFDIQHSDASKRQLVFGGGVHRCLGGALAMIELEEGLAALTQQLTEIRLDGDPVVAHGGFGIRTAQDFRIDWGRA